MDDLFGDELSLADDVSGEDSLDKGLESERLNPKAGGLSPEEEETAAAYRALSTAKPEELAEFEKSLDDGGDEEMADEAAAPPSEGEAEMDGAAPF